ncbi:hypothetical protein K438DRAFT_656810 [Mycena galopus ATCC 62051]|nr:hypothetical protein K438DRAFT_656810 [Mycena galopus ATCC 62051]
MEKTTPNTDTRAREIRDTRFRDPRPEIRWDRKREGIGIVSKKTRQVSAESQPPSERSESARLCNA